METQTFTIRDLDTGEVYRPIFKKSPVPLPSGKALWFLTGSTQTGDYFLPEGHSWDYDTYKMGVVFSNPHDDGTIHKFVVEPGSPRTARENNNEH